MKLKDIIELRRFERYLAKYGRKQMFVSMHRYLRLHMELLEDSVYKEMYDYIRNTIIKYFKRDVKCKNASDTEYGKLIDALADIYNKEGFELVEKHKFGVEEYHKFWIEFPNRKKEIRI